MAETRKESMMSECMKRCRWFVLFPVLLGIGAFAIGYYLNAESVRTLWLILAGTMVVMGVAGMAMMMFMSKRRAVNSSCCCGPQTSMEAFGNFCCGASEEPQKGNNEAT